MKMIITLALMLSTYVCAAQEIVNLVYVGDNGITQNVKEATAFIIVKQYAGGAYERLDYRMGAPLTLLRTYKDSTLESLEGPYLKYDDFGSLETSGQYKNNLKDGHWVHYNDTFKIIKEEVYDQGVFVRYENLDSAGKKDTLKYGDEREAAFSKGIKGWKKYLFDSMDQLGEEYLTLKGEVRVMFRVNAQGVVTDTHLRKSALFSLDEAVSKIIQKSPLWIPAFQHGRAVNAYRVQPFTFAGRIE